MEAISLGAWDYISKPFSPEDCRVLVKKVLEVRELRQRRMDLRPESTEVPKFIGSSATMVEFYKQIARVADSAASVLIEGESGTGKELTARSLHNMSSRSNKPFVVVHCGAIPDNLLESELFGYEKGSFTGADHQHVGLMESAQGGTIFLDEITEMSTALQGKLLRFMQDGEVRRIGGHEVRHVAVRVVAAANKNIDEEVDKGGFRLDLLYRFIVRLHIPSLRDHKEDIPMIIESLLKKMQWNEAIRVALEYLDIVGLKDRAQLPPVKLSGGEQQRVAIARAIAGQPDILIFDEPTASLDGDTGKKIVEFIKTKILNPDRCVIIVTHDSRIYEYADAIMKMEDGKITDFERNTQQDA